MVQTLDVHVQIPIPTDSVIITKVEYEAFKKESLKGVIWNIDELASYTNMNRVFVKKEILEKWSKKLDVNKGGFIRYPNKGGVYRIPAFRMIEFIEKNLPEILKKISK